MGANQRYAIVFFAVIGIRRARRAVFARNGNRRLGKSSGKPGWANNVINRHNPLFIDSRRRIYISFKLVHDKTYNTALVAGTVKLGRDVTIGPYCCVDGNVELGDNCNLIACCCYRQHHCGMTPAFSCAIGHVSQDLKYDGEEVSLEIGARNSIREHVTMNRHSPWRRHHACQRR